MYAKMAYIYLMNIQQSTLNKNERIAARVSKEHKSLFEQAARLRGLSLTDFMTHSAYEEALRVLDQHEIILHLNANDSARFVEELLNPRTTEELPVLAEAFRHYQSKQE